jgi:protocatechuate 3,4-dioxygenase beta subunit
MFKQFAAIIILSLVVSACGTNQPVEPPGVTPTRVIVEEAAATATHTAIPPTPTEAGIAETAESENMTAEDNSDTTAAAPISPVSTPSGTLSSAEPVTPVPDKAVESLDEPVETEAVIEPIEVTYFTPAQQEGPYYTIDKPADRDSDLTVLAGAAGPPAGEVLEFTGKVYNASGMPLSGLTVEIWQTDVNGAYLHPNDPTTAQRDRNFQFYGESVTGADGSYGFRTIMPGLYEPRPRHIHYKVKNGVEELFTSQIYFRSGPSLEAAGVVLDSGNSNEYLVMTVETGQDADGRPVLAGEYNIILKTNLSTPQ